MSEQPIIIHPDETAVLALLIELRQAQACQDIAIFGIGKDFKARIPKLETELRKYTGSEDPDAASAAIAALL